MRLKQEKDKERLRQAALLLEAENARLLKRNLALQKEVLALKGLGPEALQQRMEELERQLGNARQELFGASSERRPTPTPPPPAGGQPQRGHGPRAQPALPLEERVHSLDAPDRACPSCGGHLAEWAGQFEASEEVDVVARRFVLVKHLRKKYRCACGGCVETALGPVKAIPGGRYSLDFAIEVAIAKYLDHAPLERQVRAMARDGLIVDSQTLWDQVGALSRWLRPAWEALHAYVLEQALVGADETWWLRMRQGHEAPEVGQRWQLWTLAAEKAVVFLAQDSRSTDAAEAVLKDYRGVVMADGYGAYPALQKRHGGFALVHCWDHVRRKYVEAGENFGPECDVALGLIQQLYAHDAEAAQGPPEGLAERRLAIRTSKSAPVIEALLTWATTTRARVLPSSGLGKAIAYMLGLWPGLTAFLWDGRVPLSNAFTERGIRGPVVGRKNHYGSRSNHGLQAASVMYSLMESAKLNGVDPRAYLRAAVLAAIEGRPVLLPHHFPAAT